MSTPNQLVELQKTLYTSKNPTRKWLHTTRKEWILTYLNKYSKKDHNALEIGPGSGIYLPTLSKACKTITAVDYEKEYLDEASLISKTHNNLIIKADDITNSSLEDNSFDIILCTEVIEHINDSQRAFNHMYRILKPRGTAIISTPQKFSTLEIIAKIAFLPGIINIVRLVYKEPVLKTGHINLMTEKTMRDQLFKSGFKIIEHHKTGLYLPFIAEFMGELALKLEKKLEKFLLKSSFKWLLWTQYFVVTKISNNNHEL